MNRKIRELGLLLCAATGASAASAQSSTEAYTYDALGRLTRVEVAGGQNNGERHSICYDSAGNRTDYQASISGPSIECANIPSTQPPPPPPPVFGGVTISDAQVYEGEVATFTVSLSPAQTSIVSVDYVTAYGTANSYDFIAQSGTLTFSPGQTTLTVMINTKDNQLIEGDETFTISLSNPVGPASIFEMQAVGVILDDDSYEGGEPRCGDLPCP